MAGIFTIRWRSACPADQSTSTGRGNWSLGGIWVPRGRTPLIVRTPWGRVGLAVCADMMDRRVWDDYRGRIDIAVVASAWPEFACRHTGRRHRLFGHIGPMATAIPAKVAHDLGVPVIFANQTGPTRTTIPLFGLTLAIHIADRFVEQSSICNGRSAAPVIAGAGPRLVISEITVCERVRGNA